MLNVKSITSAMKDFNYSFKSYNSFISIIGYILIKNLIKAERKND